MWAQVINAALGIWLMAAPAVLGGYSEIAANNDRIAGPLAATFAVIAIWEATRGVRWMNTVIGGWLVIAPWILGYSNALATANDMLVGVLLASMSLIKGKTTSDFGGGWTRLWKHEPAELGRRASD